MINPNVGTMSLKHRRWYGRAFGSWIQIWGILRDFQAGWDAWGVYSRAAWWSSSWHGSFNHDVALCIQKLNICIHTHTCIYLILYVKVSDDVSPQKGFRSKKRTSLFPVQFPVPPISIQAEHPEYHHYIHGMIWDDIRIFHRKIYGHKLRDL